MSLYYFDLLTPSGLSKDEEGGGFDSLEAAYLNACKAALEISVDMLVRREDPNLYRFEILDHEARLVLDLPFSEVLKPAAAKGMIPLRDLRERVSLNVQRGRDLHAEITAGFEKAKRSLQATQAMLQRLES